MKHLQLLGLITPCLWLGSTTADAATVTAASCQYADVAATVALAVGGDTVIVPAGSATWADTLTIAKGVTLQGAGVGKTVINGQCILIYYAPDAGTISSKATFTVKGFTFDGHDGTSDQMSWQGLITAGTWITPAYLAIIGNEFKNTGGTAIYLRGSVFGVAADNRLDRVTMSIRAIGNDYASWSNLRQEYGTSNNFYFEDNTLVWSSPSSRTPGWTETGQGGRIVVRYNTWDVANINPLGPDEYWDIHGLQNANADGKTEAYSTMVAEYYGNRIVNDTGSYRWMYQRGGWLLMFNNSINRPSSIEMIQYFSDSTQIQGSFNQKVSNTYIWRNLSGGNEVGAWVGTASAPFPGDPANPIMENADYWLYNPSFNGSTDMGAGPLSARPVNCTVGVGYFATDQSTSDLTGMVGAHPAQPIVGTLYKCTAPNQWTAIFTPYTYPHPLRAGTTVVTNHAPVANAQSVTTTAGTAKAITLTATDADGDALSYAIVTTPTHGTLSGSGANRTYTPSAGYSGADSFAFTASDGQATSTAATVSIVVSAAIPPVADGTTLPVIPDTPLVFNLAVAGTYKLVGTVTTVDASTNSFYVDVDADPAGDNAKAWDIPYPVTNQAVDVSWRGTGTTVAEFSPKLFTLTSGSHTLYLRTREPGTGIQSIQLVAVGDVPVGTQALPSGWTTQDIGSVGFAGAAGFSNGVFTVTGSGTDIWGTADSFRFAAQTLTGDGSIVARVTAVQNTNAWAKAGVMIRESTAAGARHAFCCVTPGKGVAFQSRIFADQGSHHIAGSLSAPPRWVKLVRHGNMLYGYESADGTAWTLVGSVGITFGAAVQIGLAVTSHDNTARCAATFDHVTITPGGSG